MKHCHTTLFRALLLACLLTAGTSVVCAQDVDSLYEERVVTGNVIFPINISVIPSNAPFLRQLRDSIAPALKADGFELKAITEYVFGAASPEGPVRFNQWLAEHRNEALLRAVSRIITPPADTANIHIKVVTENYPGLVEALRESGDSYYPFVDSLVSLYFGKDEARLKRELRSANNGKMWNYLFRTYYAQLRVATVELTFHKPCRNVQKPEPKEIVVPYPAVETLDPLPLEAPELIPRPGRPRIHILALRSNLLYDIFYMPNFGWGPMWNIQAEYYPLAGHFTYNIGFTNPYYHRWSKRKFFQIRDYNFELRRYFRAAKGDAEYLGAYLGAYVNNNTYGIGFGPDKGWEGEGLGGGISAGYVMNISHNRRWRLEFNIGFGIYTTTYDPYVYGNPVTGDIDGKYYYDFTGNVSKFKSRNHRFTWFGPTQIGISLTYDLLYRRIKQKGVSLKRFEP